MAGAADGEASPTSLRAALWDRDSFIPVLVLALCSMLAFPFAGQFRSGSLIIYPFTAGLLILGLHRAKVRPRTFRAAVITLVVVGVTTVVNTLVRAITDSVDRHLVAVDMALYAVIYAIAFPAIVRRAFQHRRVGWNTLAAAITGYIVLGLWFAVIYRGLAVGLDAQFFRDVPDPQAGDFVYYSFITLTTVGYGDFVPITDGGRSIAVAEAVAGQVYLVTAVARIVSLLGSERDVPGGPATHDFGAGAGDPD